jgi:hypothetical protein
MNMFILHTKNRRAYERAKKSNTTSVTKKSTAENINDFILTFFFSGKSSCPILTHWTHPFKTRISTPRATEWKRKKQNSLVVVNVAADWLRIWMLSSRRRKKFKREDWVEPRVSVEIGRGVEQNIIFHFRDRADFKLSFFPLNILYFFICFAKKKSNSLKWVAF